MSRLTDAQKLWTGYVLGGAILATCLVISGRIKRYSLLAINGRPSLTDKWRAGRAERRKSGSVREWRNVRRFGRAKAAHSQRNALCSYFTG